MAKPWVSVLIVNWNTREHLNRCLLSLTCCLPYHPLEIIVVDNASVDGSAEMVRQKFPQVRLIAEERNIGYAAANNRAAKAAQGRYLLLLNSDTELTEGAITKLVTFADAHAEAGAIAPRLIYPDGRLQPSVRSFPMPVALLSAGAGLDKLFPRSRLLGRYRTTWFRYDHVAEVDQPMASALLVRREAWEQVGGMDETLPIFFNDVDFCWRIKKAGWRIYFLPDAVVIHHHGASTRLLGIGKWWASHQGLLRFYDKHFRPLMPIPLYLLLRGTIAAASALRIAAALVANFVRHKTKAPR